MSGKSRGAGVARVRTDWGGAMSASQHDLGKQLRVERRRLVLQLEHHGIFEQENPGLGNHMADHATEVFEQAKSLALRQRLEQSILEVDQALRRLEQGTYGLCESCGHRIDPARLDVLPTAQLCMQCQQRLETMPPCK